jgi:hypothetical protein
LNSLITESGIATRASQDSLKADASEGGPVDPEVPGTAMNSPQFGVISTDQSGNLGCSTQFGAGDYRIIQLAMKFVF